MTENKNRCGEGVWCAYRPNEYAKPEVFSIHSGEVEARRAAMDHFSPDAKVVFVEWDETIESAVASESTVPDSFPVTR